MRYVVLGAGAVGGVVGALLHEAGHPVTLVARDEHLRRIQESGLLVCTPERELRVRPDAHGSLDQVRWDAETVVLLTCKSQDTAAALDQLDRAAPPETPVVCVQNGVDNERQALRRRPNVYGVPVLLPSSFLEPGVVQAEAAPKAGVLDVGRYPDGVDKLAERLCEELASAGFESRPAPKVMAAKFRKLLRNLSNAVEAAVGPGARTSPLVQEARREALAVFAAAGVAVQSEEEEHERRRLLRIPEPASDGSSGSSSWQSLARNTFSIETDFLNGEVALLGRLHGVPTPVNAGLQRVAAAMARRGARPGSLTLAELTKALA